MDMKTKPVVAAVDFSSSSRQVLIHAARIAEFTGAPLIVAHVVSESRLRDWESTMGRSFDIAKGLAETTARLQALAATVPGTENPTVDVQIGKPYRELEWVVRQNDAGLLVIGAHDLSKRRLGTVSSRCVRSMAADVLILRDWQGGGFRAITACVDFSPTSAAGLERALTLASGYRCPLEVLHVYHPPNRDPWGAAIDPPPDEGASYADTVRERVRRRMDAFLAGHRERLSATDWHTHFIEGESPAAAITAHVAARDFDLTVIGSHQGSWLENAVLGSNAERILHDSDSSVLVVRA
jgi:nucleotide-binding universal stress UspA family protein